MTATLVACAAAVPAPPPEKPRAVAATPPRTPASLRPYRVKGTWYYPAAQPGYDETGLASWYGKSHHGKRTASGQLFDMNGLTAAHKTLPLRSRVLVTNLANGRSIEVTVNDRGPFVDGRIIDVSRRAAERLGFRHSGTARVHVRLIEPASEASEAHR